MAFAFRAVTVWAVVLKVGLAVVFEFLKMPSILDWRLPRTLLEEVFCFSAAAGC